MSSALLLLHAVRLSNIAIGLVKDKESCSRMLFFVFVFVGKDHVRQRKLALMIQKPKLSTQALED